MMKKIKKFESISTRFQREVWRKFPKPFSGILVIKCEKTKKVFITYSLNDLELVLQRNIWKLRENRHSNGSLQNDYNLYKESSFSITYKSKKYIPKNQIVETNLVRRNIIKNMFNQLITKNKKGLYNLNTEIYV